MIDHRDPSSTPSVSLSSRDLELFNSYDRSFGGSGLGMLGPKEAASGRREDYSVHFLFDGNIALLATAAIASLSFSALAVCSLSGTSIGFGNYGRVPTGRSVSKGTYGNTITATINF